MKVKQIILMLAVVGVVALGRIFPIADWLKLFLDWVSGLGAAGAVVFVGIYILACVLFIPGSLLTLGAGAIYGVVWGSVIVSVASTLGAVAAFCVGRYFARDWIGKKVEANPKFKSIDQAVAKEGWKIVGLTRLSPIFPFNLLNYAYGLTRVSLPHYFFASWIGMMPGTVMYVYLGSAAGSLATLGSGGAQKSTAEWALYAVGLIATVVVTIYVTKIAKKALSEKIA